MRHLRVYDYRGDMIADMPNVTWSTVTNPGVLVVRLNPESPGGTVLRAFAAGYWGEAAEIPAPATLPIVPGAVTDADIEDLMAGSDAAAVRAAMAVHCICESLRCTTILNPATREEKEAARTRWRRKADGPPAPAEPLKRCVRARGHNQEELECFWAPGVWIYGAAEHHTGCPRHPARYNNIEKFTAPEEGQPQHDAAGFTSPTYVPVMLVPEPEPEVSTTLVRPFIERHQGGLTGLDRADVPEMFAAETYLRAQREMWKACAVPGPDTYPFTTWCTLSPGHDGDLHEMDRPDERISWQRQGGRR